MNSLPLADAAATEHVGFVLADLAEPGDVILLTGELGAGKTTLARGLLRGLGLPGEAPSPSFSLVIGYAPPELRLPVWHVDLYRLELSVEMDELGLDETDDGLLLVEWPDRVGAERWIDALTLHLGVAPDGGRRLTWTAGASWHGRWPPAPPI